MSLYAIVIASSALVALSSAPAGLWFAIVIPLVLWALREDRSY